MASEIVSQGRAAWGRLKQGSRSWEDWKIVGAALLEGRVVAMRDARAWHPIGRAYSSALDSWLLDNRLNVPLSNRADLFTLMGMLPEVEAWRATLTETRRQRLNRPVSVLTAYPASDRDQARAGARHRAVGVKTPSSTTTANLCSGSHELVDGQPRSNADASLASDGALLLLADASIPLPNSH